MIRVAHITDLHLSPERLDEQAAILGSFATEAIRCGADLAVVTGDLWGETVPYRPGVALLAATGAWLRRLSQSMPVIVLAGNHDDLGSLSLLALDAAAHPIHVIRDVWGTGHDDVRLWTPHGSVDVYALAYVRRGYVARTAGTGADATASRLASTLLRAQSGLIARDRADDPADAVLGLGHWLVAGSMTGHGEVLRDGEPVVQRRDLDDWRVDYACLGHLHARQTVGERASYGGSPWPTDFGDLGVKAWSLVDIGERGAEDARPSPIAQTQTIDAAGGLARVEIHTVPTGARPWVTLDYRWGLGGGVPVWRDLPDETPAEGAHVRARLRIPADLEGTCPWRETIDRVAAVAASMAEPVVIRERGERDDIRAPEIVHAADLAAQVEAWAGSLAEPLDAASIEATIAALDEIAAHTDDEITARSRAIAEGAA